ncbi:dephospho-CoA kinase [Pedococcus bigeumensis]|uniref:Dephospho-CoA kinase n=1 Tax=Pedococcus bigeumensis TaxID=433644 RepID=A0A502CYZ9_9MICO|nr:dephospho-CoA kinase [Pedococcus bigeumensis]TPG17862.1 dephospho-CoA kinase [Pedococcus bigeumensis]
MLRVGLTGGIGSGKSTVAQRFSELGAVVIDADLLAREVVAPGSSGLTAIVDRFGDGVLDDEGALNRPALGAIVFADGRSRRDLEGITHPLIARRTAELVAAAPDDAIVVHDVPLLVEKHYGPGYHLVVVVGAAAETRVKRLMHTRGMAETDARSRIASQATDEERREAADVWLENDGHKDDLLTSVGTLWRERLVPFEENVRTGTRSQRPERLALHEPDPTWPDQAARLLARLRHVLGDVVVTADHVGSTAVPGLIAKDVIDLQLGVRALADIDDPAVLERLRQGGFPLVGGVRSDFDRGSQGEWPKRMLGSADPARIAHIHVREVGSDGWRWALVFRDWMRAGATARAEYAVEKQRLAATIETVTEYTEAKEPWFDSVNDRARAWAEATGWQPPRG